jgi:hypothetical protein
LVGRFNVSFQSKLWVLFSVFAENACIVNGTPSKSENASVSRAVCATPAFEAFLMCEIQSVRTEGVWKNLLQICLKQIMPDSFHRKELTFQNRLFGFNPHSGFM